MHHIRVLLNKVSPKHIVVNTEQRQVPLSADPVHGRVVRYHHRHQVLGQFRGRSERETRAAQHSIIVAGDWQPYNRPRIVAPEVVNVRPYRPLQLVVYVPDVTDIPHGQRPHCLNQYPPLLQKTLAMGWTLLTVQPAVSSLQTHLFHAAVRASHQFFLRYQDFWLLPPPPLLR